MESTHIEALAELERALQEVSYERTLHQRDLGQLVASNHGLTRSYGAAPGTDPSRSGTAFAVSALYAAGLLRDAITSFGWDKLPKYLGDDLLNQIGPIPEGSRPDPDKNEYSVPIWVCGLLSVARVEQSIAASIRTSCQLKEAVKSIATLIHANKGSLRRVSTSPSAPFSAYLTLWATVALLLAEKDLDLDADDKSHITRALEAIAAWSEVALSQLITSHHAGLAGRFDVVECICAACVGGRVNDRLQGRSADELQQLSVYATTLALSSYFEGGSFKLSRPVFADEKYNAILCPTAETLLLILSSFDARALSQIFNERWRLLMEAFRWSQRNRHDMGYPPDAGGPFSPVVESTVFSTSATIAFFRLLERTLDDLLDKTARIALEVPAVPVPAQFKYPPQLGEAIREKVVNAIEDPVRRPFAKHSIILHGPPGTAKTSIAKQIAADLVWPLKIITQADFLKTGREFIETEAHRIFTACMFLNNVVVLFDELEELILERDPAVDPSEEEGWRGSDKESRLLTTSMLPKIHELRDRRRIVFIFATNRLREIDHAATRLGRFDMLFGVDYPPREFLKEAAIKFVEDMKLVCGAWYEQVVELVQGIDFDRQPQIRSPHERAFLTYKDVEYIIGGIIEEYCKAGKPPDLDQIDREILRRHEVNKRVRDARHFTRLKEQDRI